MEQDSQRAQQENALEAEKVRHSPSPPLPPSVYTVRETETALKPSLNRVKSHYPNVNRDQIPFKIINVFFHSYNHMLAVLH